MLHSKLELESRRGNMATIWIGAVIGKVLAEKATLKTRLEGLRDSHVGIWRTSIASRRNSICKDSRQEHSANWRTRRPGLVRDAGGVSGFYRPLWWLWLGLTCAGTQENGMIQLKFYCPLCCVDNRWWASGWRQETSEVALIVTSAGYSWGGGEKRSLLKHKSAGLAEHSVWG